MSGRKPTISKATQAIIAKRKTLRLDIGCGANKQGPDCFGIDLRKLPGVDLVHDVVGQIPWPLPDNCARVAFMSHFWEHIIPWRTLPFMAELHRVLQHDAQVLVAGPYGVEFRFVQDPTHCNPTNEATFHYFDNRHPLWEVYRPPVFHVESFDRIPAGMSRDFNAILRCCKPGAKGCTHA